MSSPANREQTLTGADVTHFYERVMLYAKGMVERKVWSGIDHATLESWALRFDQYDARALAAALLDNLIYRSKPQFLALLEYLMLTIRIPPYGDQHDRALIDALARRSDPKVRLVPVIRMDQPPTKSATYVLRLMQRKFRIRDQWLIWPQEISNVPEGTAIILVDDLSGSGDQFDEFWKAQALSELAKTRADLKFHLATAAIHQCALERIRKDYPITVNYAELLGPQHHFLNGEVLNQYKRAAFRELVVAKHAEVVAAVGLNRSPTIPATGYDDLGLCYAFEHATPNNSLPILWMETETWHPLLNR